MDWNDFIRPFRQSELFGDAAWKILQSFFNTAGCINDPAEETLKSWLYSKRNCKVNTYFPNGQADSNRLFRYFKNRPERKLQQLQQVFRNQAALGCNSPIDTETSDLDIFCWSLVNQFLDLLGFQRVEIPQKPVQSGNELDHIGQLCEKCCLYCIHWQGDKSTVGPYRMPTQGICYTHQGKNKHRMQRRSSSSDVCKDYQADQKLINNMKRVGYNVENLI